MSNKVIAANKLDNQYWEITVIDPINKSTKKVINSTTGLPIEFYRVLNNFQLKNYPYSELDNNYIYFEKRYTPKFIAKLIYLFLTFAKENNIEDNDLLKIDAELNKQGLTLSKYGIYKIKSDMIYPCLTINPYPKSLHYKCGTIDTNHTYLNIIFIIMSLIILVIIYWYYVKTK